MDNTIVTLVDQIITNALALEASDIHCEPTGQELRLRYRIDGILMDQNPIPLEHASQVVARLKVLAHVDVAEKRIPQDGKFCVQGQHGEIDLRVATFPTRFGEKVVIRILDRSHHVLDLQQLGFSPHARSLIQRIISQPTGFCIVTGPTGSGKTTTLYAILTALQTPEKNIVTLEDPIEYNFDGITQGQVYPDIGFTFATGIRALLRQDPDIIMVGEIRDRETAQVAVQAALTGHFVLSTLHTNDAASTVMRLLDMGIEPFLLNAAVTGIIAQRLVRKLCEHCRSIKQLSPDEAKFIQENKLALHQAYVARGCEQCHHLGHKGRIGIFEILPFSQELRNLITHAPSYDAIYAQALTDKMIPLRQDAAYKVQHGIISMQELIRVIG